MPTRPPFVHASTSYDHSMSVPPRSLGQHVSSASHASTSCSAESTALEVTVIPHEKHETRDARVYPPKELAKAYTDYDYPAEKEDEDEWAVYEHPHHGSYSTHSSDRDSRIVRCGPGAIGFEEEARGGGGGGGGGGGVGHYAQMGGGSATGGTAGHTFGSRRGRDGGRLGRALVIGWIGTTVLFLLATAFWKGELFRALDRLSTQLREMGYTGQAIFGLLIFLTTIPPLPLYSTLMVLAGYTFGVRTGFAISYLSSLLGAVLVFIVSRSFLRDCITACLADSPTSMSLLAILPSRPHLLLLIRIAPYPFNLLNAILASSPSLTLGMYTGTTALSLLKVVLHTWLGSGIHDISEMHSHAHSHSHSHLHHHDPARERVKMYASWGGVLLCLALVFYLHHIAKRALRRAQEETELDGRIQVGQIGRDVASGHAHGRP